MCRCRWNEADPNCGRGLYLLGKLQAVYQVLACWGFLALREETRKVVRDEQEHWQREYSKHVAKEGEV